MPIDHVSNMWVEQKEKLFTLILFYKEIYWKLENYDFNECLWSIENEVNQNCKIFSIVMNTQFCLEIFFFKCFVTLKILVYTVKLLYF